jgi:hypothetical protein
LLFKIKRVHDASEDVKVSRHISQMIAEVWNTYFGNNTFETRVCNSPFPSFAYEKGNSYFLFETNVVVAQVLLWRGYSSVGSAERC